MQFEPDPERSFQARMRPSHEDGLFIIKSANSNQAEVVKEIKASNKAGDELTKQEDAILYGDQTGLFFTVPGVLYIGRYEMADAERQHDGMYFSGDPTTTIIEVEPTDY